MNPTPDQNRIDELVSRLRKRDAGKTAHNGHVDEHSVRSFKPSPPMSDDEVIDRCRGAENAAKFATLFDDGDIHAYHGGDDSAADAALIWIMAFYTQDPEQLEHLARRSALRRPKWEENRVGKTWLRYTIDRILPKLTETWQPSDGAELSLNGELESSLSSSANPLRDSSDDDNNKDDALEGIVWFSEQGEPKEREYLIEGVAVKKYTVVAYGAGGVAKSFAMLSAGIAIAGGAEKWLGLQVLDHGYVLYLDFELDAEEQHRRVRDLCTGLGVKTPEKFAYFSALGMPTEQAFKKARVFIERYDTKAVIIDSMGLAMVGDMDHAKDVIAFHRQYTDQLRALGVTPFVVDHEGKLQAGENRKEKGPIGSAYKSWVTRSVLQFTLEEYNEETSSLDIRVRQHKTNFKPTKPFGVRFTFEEKKVSIEPIDLPDTELIDEAYVPVKERIVAALKPGEATIRELQTLTGAEVGTIRNKLSELKNEGRVIDAGYRGREKLYALPGSPNLPDPNPPDPDSLLLSSSGNPYRETGDDDNERNDTRYGRALEAFEHGNAPRKALENYRKGAQDRESVVRSVMHYYGRGKDDFEAWEGPVTSAMAIVLREEGEA